ncbi:MAG: DUF488 domain-containing protein [Treponema sp.]|nr:DUF488 domain-containing protein [Treponema sp.]
MKQLYTIGCSILSLDDFIRNLKSNGINVVADVRSVPYSRTTPQFNRELLKERLKKERIIYGDFSKEFGARRTEFNAYKNNQVSFEKTKKLPEFMKGIQRIQNGLNMGYSIALMCTEKNPLECHRFSLVSRGIFEKTGIQAIHILADTSFVSTEQLEKEIIEKFGLQEDLFSDSSERLKEAYELLNKKIGYILPTQNSIEMEKEAYTYDKDIYMFG